MFLIMQRCSFCLLVFFALVLTLAGNKLVFAVPVALSADVSGDVFFSKTGDLQQMAPFTPFTLLEEGDWVQTGENSSLRILFRGGSELFMLPNSLLQILFYHEQPPLHERKFLMRAVLYDGAVLGRVGQEVVDFAMEVGWFELAELRDGCFAAAYDSHVGTLQLKVADKSFVYKEGLYEEILDPYEVLQPKIAFQLSPQQQADFSPSTKFKPPFYIEVTGQDQLRTSLLHLQLRDASTQQDQAASFPLAVLQSFPYPFKAKQSLDSRGQLFLAPQVPPGAVDAGYLVCIEPLVLSRLFSTATAVIRR